MACYLGKYKAICEMTEKAMSGEMTVEDAFAERIRLLSPTKQEITSFLQSHVPQINPGVASFLSLLRKRGTEYYLVSGGFLELIEPLCHVLQIPFDHVVCNHFRFASDGSCLGYDTTRWTCKSHGKSLAIRSILESHGWVHSVMIGDGVTDLETRDVVDAFIGYAGVKDREVVQNAADLSVTSFETLLPFLL